MFDPEQLAAMTGLALESSGDSYADFRCNGEQLRVTAYAPGVFRLTMGDTTLPEYPIVVGGYIPIPLRVQESLDAYKCVAGGYELRFGKAPLTLSLRQVLSNKTILPVTEDAHFVRRFRLPPVAKTEEGWFMALGLPFDTPVYGGGEQYGPLNRRGLLMRLWNEDALGVNSNLSYKNCPFLWSPDGWGLFVNTPSLVNFGVGYPQWSNQSLCLDVHDERLDLFIFAGDTPAILLEHYADLTGHAPEAPDWSLGVWLSKAYYRSPAETLEAARLMRDNDFPCDVITLDGRAWQDTETRFLFEWCPERYNNPKTFCQELKALGYKICVWEYPLVSVNNSRFKELSDKGYFLKNATGATYRYQFDSKPFGKVLTQLPDSGVLDFTNPEAYQFWKDSHKALFEAGVDSIKADFGEQVLPDMHAANGDDGKRLHNVYSLLYNLCVYEASRDFYGDQALNWCRAGWAGSQRAPMQWAGDSESSWGGLAASIMGGLSWGMSGVPYYAHDIGGFYGEQPSPELFARWTEAATFFSHMRFHGIGPREPWAYGAEVEAICRRFVKLRYRLIPVIRDACRQAAQTGMPVQRSMALAFPGQRVMQSFDTQFMLGDSLFVAPVLQSTGDVCYRLPRGLWYDFWTGKPREGAVTVRETMPLDKIPVYVKEGTVLKLGPVADNTSKITQSVKEVVAYGTPHAASCLYDDMVGFDGRQLCLAPGIRQRAPERMAELLD